MLKNKIGGNQFFSRDHPRKGEMEIGMVISATGTGFGYMIGGWDQLTEALLFAMVIDDVSVHKGGDITIFSQPQ